MPVVGFGVFQVKDEEECKRVVLDAIDAGYRLIDTAQSYGNEEAVGKAIQETNVPREELFITTKVWIDHYGYEECKASVEESFRKLKTDYFGTLDEGQKKSLRELFDNYISGFDKSVPINKLRGEMYVILS